MINSGRLMKSSRKDILLSEVWKSIPQYPGYEASSLGRVRSIDRVIVDKRGRTIRRKGQILKPYYDDDTSPYGCFRAGPETAKVHVCVCSAFHGEPPEGKPYACHLDGKPRNSTPSNLVWGSAQENQLHRNGHDTTTQGEAHHMAKLTTADVIDIRERALRGERQDDIAATYGITQSQVSNIKTGARWAHVQHSIDQAA